MNPDWLVIWPKVELPAVTAMLLVWTRLNRLITSNLSCADLPPPNPKFFETERSCDDPRRADVGLEARRGAERLGRRERNRRRVQPRRRRVIRRRPARRQVSRGSEGSDAADQIRPLTVAEEAEVVTLRQPDWETALEVEHRRGGPVGEQPTRHAALRRRRRQLPDRRDDDAMRHVEDAGAVFGGSG